MVKRKKIHAVKEDSKDTYHTQWILKLFMSKAKKQCKEWKGGKRWLNWLVEKTKMTAEFRLKETNLLVMQVL